VFKDSSRLETSKAMDLDDEPEPVADNFEVTLDEARRFVETAGGLGKVQEWLDTWDAEQEVRLHDTIMEMFDWFEVSMAADTTKLTNQAIFRKFSHHMVMASHVRVGFVEWLGTRVAMRWLRSKKDFTFADIRKIRDYVKELSTTYFSKGVFAGYSTLKAENATKTVVVRTALGWDMAEVVKSWGLQNFDFSLPLNLDDTSALIAQVQAQTLVKADKFFVKCPVVSWSDVWKVRFRAQNVQGRRSLEARFLGTSDKYPVLQPWTKFRDRIIMFYGSAGKEIFNNSEDLAKPLRGVEELAPLTGGRVFRVGMVDREPVVVIHTVFGNGGLTQVCVGATSHERLETFLHNMRVDTPFVLQEYLDFLGVEMPPRSSIQSRGIAMDI